MKFRNFEAVILVIFLLSVLVWAMGKCSSKKRELTRTELEEEDDRPTKPKRDTVFVPNATPAPATSAPVTAQPVPSTQPLTAQPIATQPAAVPPPGRTPATTPAATAAKPATAAPTKYSTLFVTIDGLKMRKEPGLKGAAVAKLDLYEQVYFLNQKTEWTQEISLGKETVTDHWVKIKTKAGKEGWVFGAGVHYYKMKRKGVLE